MDRTGWNRKSGGVAGGRSGGAGIREAGREGENGGKETGRLGLRSWRREVGGFPHVESGGGRKWGGIGETAVEEGRRHNNPVAAAAAT